MEEPLHEAGVEELMKLYEKIEEAYARTYFETPEPCGPYATSTNP